MSKEEIEEQFDQYGVIYNDAIIEKCVELCLEYGVTDAAEFAENWLAYTVSKLNGADPTVTTITEMARNEYENKEKKQSTNIKSEDNDGGLKVYGNYVEEDVDDDIMDSYIDPTSPKRKVARPQQLKTPKTPKLIFTPASYSPLPLNESKKVNEEAGNALCTFGRAQLVNLNQWSQFRKGNLRVSLSSIGDGKYMSANTLYMVAPSIEHCQYEYEELYKIGVEICKRFQEIECPSRTVEEILQEDYGLNIDENKPFPYDKIRCLGRVHTETENISEYNIFIVALQDEQLIKLPLDLIKCKGYSLFPGQIVLVEGILTDGDTIMVDRILSATNLTYTPTPKLALPLSIVVASGPYTAHDNLAYEPLQDLVKYCTENPPDILILTGPIVQKTNTAIHTMAERFDRHFERLISQLVKNLDPNTHVLLVSSHEDINSTFVYPTHPYDIKTKFPNLHLLPDPCIVEVDGVHIGITSTDIMNNLNENQLSVNEGNDVIKRSVYYMFHQKSFFPLRKSNIPVDIGLMHQYAKLNTLPNLLILPSKMKQFIRDYNNCLCINPGHVFGETTGSFGRVTIHPTESQTGKLFSCVAGQVVKI